MKRVLSLLMGMAVVLVFGMAYGEESNTGNSGDKMIRDEDLLNSNLDQDKATVNQMPQVSNGSAEGSGAGGSSKDSDMDMMKKDIGPAPAPVDTDKAPASSTEGSGAGGTGQDKDSESMGKAPIEKAPAAPAEDMNKDSGSYGY